MLKRILTVLIVALCLLLPAAALGEWENVAENERFTLCYDPQESQIMLKDALTNAEWRSTPADIDQDKIASGMNVPDASVHGADAGRHDGSGQN